MSHLKKTNRLEKSSRIIYWNLPALKNTLRNISVGRNIEVTKLKYENGRIYIFKAQYYDDVP